MCMYSVGIHVATTVYIYDIHVYVIILLVDNTIIFSLEPNSPAKPGHYLQYQTRSGVWLDASVTRKCIIQK